MARIKVTVERIDGYCNLPMLVGDHFYVEGLCTAAKKLDILGHFIIGAYIIRIEQ